MAFFDRVQSVTMADSSSPGSVYVRAAKAGKIVAAGSTILNAITVANTNITLKLNGVAVTGGAWVIAYSGSAAYDKDDVTTTPTTVAAGDLIEFASDGGATTTCVTAFSVTIR